MARISSDPIANYRGHIGKISYYIRECENMARKSLSAGKISDSPANAFMSLNKETCTQEDDTLTVDYEQLQCAQGSLTEPDITATYNTSTSKSCLRTRLWKTSPIVMRMTKRTGCL